MERAPKFPCAFCQEGHYGDAGGSYDRAHCEEAAILRQIETLRLVTPQTPKESEGWRRDWDRLHKRLEQVRYVGD